MFSFLAEKLNVKNFGEILAPTLTPEQQLHQAIEDGALEKMTFLIEEEKVDPNARNAVGNQPIHTAAYYGRLPPLEFLLLHNVDLKALGSKDNTVLHFAAAQGHIDMVKILIEKGCNPAARNGNGKTPYDVAKGDTLRQYLLPLQFKNEDPSIYAANLPAGITPSADPNAPKPVIAPPPMVPAYSPPGSFTGRMPPQPSRSNIIRDPSVFRPIQADGFGSSVGNEELTAKFGNSRDVKVTAPPPTLPLAAGNPAPVISAGYNPYVQGRYTTYDPHTNTGYAVGPPTLDNNNVPKSPPKAVLDPPKFTIFNPNANKSTSTTASPVAIPTIQPTVGSPMQEEAPIDFLASGSAIQ